MYKKYPRTFHLPFSEGVQSDDKIMKDLSSLEGKEVIVTYKMDGENTTLYRDHMHARSIDSAFHESRSWVKQWWSTWKHDIPVNMRICGENLYAQHSIAYNNLKSYFYGFNIWEDDRCLSWGETMEYFDLFGITPVEVIYDGPFNILNLMMIAKQLDTNIHEGFVVRNKESFDYADFSKNVVKYVRKNHVQTSSHWQFQAVIKNKLIDNA